jgi:hypothetical protein
MSKSRNKLGTCSTSAAGVDDTGTIAGAFSGATASADESICRSDWKQLVIICQMDLFALDLGEPTSSEAAAEPACSS